MSKNENLEKNFLQSLSTYRDGGWNHPLDFDLLLTKINQPYKCPAIFLLFLIDFRLFFIQMNIIMHGCVTMHYINFRCMISKYNSGSCECNSKTAGDMEKIY